jgi:diacylglycerol kinase family enzyme
VEITTPYYVTIVYYYIFDIRQCKNKAQAEKMKDHLAELGISGEYTFPSQVRSAKELVKDALGRGFSTIVAIGNDRLINNVASEVIGTKAAFGIIPLNASSEINQLVNGHNWHDAALALRFRKIKEIKLGQFENGEHFLISTILNIKQPVNITLEFDDFIAQARASQLSISNFESKNSDERQAQLSISMISEKENDSRGLGRLLNFFEVVQENGPNKLSRFHAKRLRVFSHKNLNFVVNKEDIATTPQMIKVSSNYLRLIISRDSVL